MSYEPIDIASGLRIAASDARVAAHAAGSRGDTTAAVVARDLVAKFDAQAERYEAQAEATA